jgi:hypothetical protein
MSKSIFVDYDNIIKSKIHLKDTAYGQPTILCRTFKGSKVSLYTEVKNRVTCEFCLKKMRGRQVWDKTKTKFRSL